MITEREKIFVADDDDDIVHILSLMLQTKGYEVQTSRDATEILTFTPGNLPDLVMLDIWMSGVDGREICRKLKEDPVTRHIPVLFISANANIQEITNESMADGFIAKPFEMEDMLTKVKATLASSGINR